MCRRTKLEKKLSEYQAEVDEFREKEVPRQVEDIKTIISQLDGISDTLEEAKVEAMVCMFAGIDDTGIFFLEGEIVVHIQLSNWWGLIFFVKIQEIQIYQKNIFCS